MSYHTGIEHFQLAWISLWELHLQSSGKSRGIRIQSPHIFQFDVFICALFIEPFIQWTYIEESTAYARPCAMSGGKVVNKSRLAPALMEFRVDKGDRRETFRKPRRVRCCPKPWR